MLNEEINNKIEINLSSGFSINIKYILFRPKNNTENKKLKRISFLAGIHGHELNGIEVIRRLEQYLKTQKLRHEVLLIPIANPAAFSERKRRASYDNKDLNRNFPGNKEGTLTERMAYELFNLLKTSTYVVDMHTGPEGRVLIPHPRLPSTDHKIFREMARVYGTIISMSRDLIENSLALELWKKKIPCLTVELGEANRIKEYFVKYGFYGAINLLKYYRFLDVKDERISIPARQYILSKRKNIYSQHLGLFYPEVRLGDIVSRNTLIGRIYDIEDNKYIDLISDSRGLVLAIQTYSVTRPGDIVFSMMPLTNLYLNNVELIKKRHTIYYAKDINSTILSKWLNGI